MREPLSTNTEGRKMTRHKTPKKPEMTRAPMGVLVSHHNDRLNAYNEATVAFCSHRKIDPADRLREPVDETADRDELVKAIRKMHVRLGDTIRDRSIQLLLEKVLDEKGDVKTDEDGRLVGMSYQEILDVLAVEHPYASTSAACLRWYIVQVADEVDEEGEPLYEFPEYRPRSKSRKTGSPV